MGSTVINDRPFFYAKIIKVMATLFKNKDYQKAMVDVVKDNADNTKLYSVLAIMAR